MCVLETSGRENDAVFTVSESRGLHDNAEDAVLETCGRENDAVLTVSESRENFVVLTVSESSSSVKAGENGEFGLLEVIMSDFSPPLAHSKSLSNSSRVSSHVGCTGLALPSASACALAACSHGSCSAPSSAVVPLCMLVVTHVHVKIRVRTRSVHRVPRGEGGSKVGVSGPAEDLRPASEVEAGVNFRPASGVRGQVAGSLPGRQAGTGSRQVKGTCGHTFPPPGGSWYPIRVTRIWIGHQAIDGLDEGVWNCTIGDLGAKG